MSDDTATDRVELVLDFDLGLKTAGADCVLCGGSVFDGGAVGIAVRDGGRVCESCTEHHAPGIGLYDMAQALDRLDTALTFTPTSQHRFLLANFLEGMQKLLELRGIE